MWPNLKTLVYVLLFHTLGTVFVIFIHITVKIPITQFSTLRSAIFVFIAFIYIEYLIRR